jgi:hypothetical protein
LTRPSGSAEPVYLTPDILLDDSSSPEALAQRLP